VPEAAGDSPAEPARSIAPPGQNHSLDLDLPPLAEPEPADPQPAPAPSAPKADEAKPVSPSGTPT
jgi:sec-independent protein translocase protein TatB